MQAKPSTAHSVQACKRDVTQRNRQKLWFRIGTNRQEKEYKTKRAWERERKAGKKFN